MAKQLWSVDSQIMAGDVRCELRGNSIKFTVLDKSGYPKPNSYRVRQFTNEAQAKVRFLAGAGKILQGDTLEGLAIMNPQ